MSTEMPEGDPDEFAEPEPRSWRSAAPFLIAVGFIGVIVLVIVLSGILRPADERLSDSAKISRVVDQLYSARNALDYDKFRDATCAKDASASTFPTAAQFKQSNEADAAKSGKLSIDISDTEVSGDRASTQVTWHREKTQRKQEKVRLVLENDEWKVCSR